MNLLPDSVLNVLIVMPIDAAGTGVYADVPRTGGGDAAKAEIHTTIGDNVHRAIDDRGVEEIEPTVAAHGNGSVVAGRYGGV